MNFTDFVQRTHAFMASNLVVITFGPDPARPGGPRMDGVHRMTLIKSANQGVRGAGNTPTDMWRIERPDAWNGGPNGPNVFRAYWCEYAADELHLQIVERAADLMFTARMNGCSFGVGSATPSGARIVGHANVSRASADAPGFATQQGTQNAQLAEAMGPAVGLIDAHAYSPLGSDQSGTTFGIRNPGDGQWGFYTLTYSGTGAGARHRGLAQIA